VETLQLASVSIVSCAFEVSGVSVEAHTQLHVSLASHAQLRLLLVQMDSLELSMGMSGDFESAVRSLSFPQAAQRSRAALARCMR
jgi:hypothetical protein